jgi:carbon-monoxide dehydrogenase medium subunit
MREFDCRKGVERALLNLSIQGRPNGWRPNDEHQRAGVAVVIPGPFAYHRPTTVEEAARLLAELGEDARPLAGGHSLVPMMKLRLAQPEHLIDLGRIGSLRVVREEGSEIVIGAMTTQHELIASTLLADKCPILREAALVISDPQVRYCGTVGGNVANGDPGNDLPAVMQCLGASYVLQSAGGERRVAARDFYEGAYFTKLQAGELLTAVRIPAPPSGHGHAYEKMKRKVGDYATAATAVVLVMDGGRCAQASIALTNLADTPLHAEDAAKALVGTTVDDQAIEAAVAAAVAITSPPASDPRGPADYRRHVAGVMTRRAIRSALARARGGA